jgi:hypothetical protein
LHIGDPAVGCEPGFRPLAVAPALVVEIENDIAGLVERAGVIRQIDVPLRWGSPLFVIVR